MAVDLSQARTRWAGMSGWRTERAKGPFPIWVSRSLGRPGPGIVVTRRTSSVSAHGAQFNLTRRVTWIVRYPEWWVVSLWRVTQHPHKPK